ncbi:MAG: DUF5995 family protein [Actinomycetota bacterium]|nr:DUF5995 family protein [Actinomycetota bacterium]
MSLARLLFPPNIPRVPLGDLQVRSDAPATVAIKHLDDLIEVMQDQLARYESERDRRRFFLEVYKGMTERIRKGVEVGRFLDSDWLTHLTYRFADLYFDAEKAFDASNRSCPAAWERAFDLTVKGDATAVECVLLGMNAHIGYDLPQVVAGMLRDFDLSKEVADDESRLVGRLALRKFDFDTVNVIIAETIDSAQDLIAAGSSIIGVIDRLTLRLDELLSELFIRYVRDLSWAHGLALAFSRHDLERELALGQIEEATMFGIRRVDLVSYLPSPLQALPHRWRRAF